MSYILSGKLQGYVSPDCLEPFTDVTVKLYRHRETEEAQALAAANPKHTFKILSPEEVRAKEYLLIGQTRTNDVGEFSIDLNTKSVGGHRGWTGQYAGEPLEIDVYCRTVLGKRPENDREAVQATLTTIQPEWQESGGNHTAHWEYSLSQRFWAEVRGALDVWVVCGRVTSQRTEAPLSGVRVHAFDADMAEDDHLGSAVTDAEGRFRIDFNGVDFRKTPTRWANYEIGGPDLYFKVEGADGTVLLDEDKSRGSQPDRDNAGSCTYIELSVGAEKGATAAAS